ncbi:MAG TPA: glutamyl-tRNA reductase [Solirubrobacteraceae bacterium]|nr:glutamyl-tRNA reductase [Solirubrobacteraceae bacterium]
MSELLLLGVSHKTAPVALRERLALTATGAADFVRRATTGGDVREAVVISTCNRTEMYLVADDPVAAETTVLSTLARRTGIRPTELAEVIYSPRNCDAARQLFRVTAGLESMIVGESEIQGQVRRAHETSVEAGASGPLTDRLFTAALQTGGRVRAETKIGHGRASMSSVAVELAGEVVGHLEDRHVVIIGAGETAELTARALAERGVRTIFVANRHAARARSVAERVGGLVVPLDRLPEQLAEADIVVSSTSSPHAIVGSEELELVMRERGGRPLMLIDIAVPRDVDPACADIDGVTLYDIDDLQAVVARNLGVRAAETRKAEAIVEDEIQRFAGWLGGHEVLPTVAALRAHADEIVDRVLAENAGKWESASPRDLHRVEAMTRAAVNRLLHEPTIRLRAMGTGASHGRLALLRELFGLERGDDDEAAAGNVRSLRR